MARRLRHTADPIIAMLQEHTGNVTAQEVIRRHGISLDTFSRRKWKYGGVDKPELHRLQALEDENRPVTRAVAEQALDIQVLKDAVGTRGDCGRKGGRPRMVVRSAMG